jgi:hypothetical protein
MIMTWINNKTSVNPILIILFPEKILTYLVPAYLDKW